jgi:hypothetical protein
METSGSDQSHTYSEPERYSTEARLIFTVSFILSFFMLLAARVMPSSWHGTWAQNIHHKSIFAEANDSAQTCVSFAFMG